MRPFLDEIENPTKPPVIILKYLDDVVARASRKQRFTKQEIKSVAKKVLKALQVRDVSGQATPTSKLQSQATSAIEAPMT